jgi:peptidoglycan L-alanyl-D-glutamate endopeptidase CwlK
MNKASLAKLEEVHPELKRLMLFAEKAAAVPFEVSEGKRSLARQKLLVAAGASWTMNSRHLTGHAVDIFFIIGRKARWDWPLYIEAANHIKACSLSLNIPIIWGGDWRKLKDGPHFELNRKFYP